MRIGVVNGGDENLAVADFAGLGRLDDGLTACVGEVVRQHGFDFDLGQEIHGVFAAAINFGVAFLAAKTLDLGDGHALDADFVQGVFDVVQFERLDDGFDFFHKNFDYSL
jgi:hypothetical protein